MKQFAWLRHIIAADVPAGWAVVEVYHGTLFLSPNSQPSEFHAKLAIAEPEAEMFRQFRVVDVIGGPDEDCEQVRTLTLRSGSTDILPNAVERVQTMWTNTGESFVWKLFSCDREYWLTIKIVDGPSFREREQVWTRFIKSIQIVGDIRRLLSYGPGPPRPKRRRPSARRLVAPADWPDAIGYLAPALLALQEQPVEDIENADADMSVAMRAIKKAYRSLTAPARARRAETELKIIKHWCDAHKDADQSLIAAASALQGLLFYEKQHGISDA